MKININDLFKISDISIKKTEGAKHENLLAFASIKLQAEDGIGYFTISGFTIWNSKFGGLNVEMPKNRNFKFCLFEKSLWQKLKKEILDKYSYETIPVVE